jgi:hypothetical protein
MVSITYHFDISSEAKAWKTVARLCQRVYWTRLWIIQEVYFAAKIVLYSGNSYWDWENFERLCKFVDYVKTTSFNPIYPIADQIIRSTPYRLDQERQRRAGVKHEAPFQERVLSTYWSRTKRQSALTAEIKCLVYIVLRYLAVKLPRPSIIPS